MKHTNDLTVGKGLDEFLNAKELYLVVKLDNHSFNPWSNEVITLTQNDIEFRYEQRGSDFLIKKNLYLPIKDMVLFTDLHEAQVYRAELGWEALQYATSALQSETSDWYKSNKELLDKLVADFEQKVRNLKNKREKPAEEPSPDLSKDIFRQGAKPRKKK